MIRLRKLDGSDLVVPGRTPLSLAALLFFLARWSDGDALSYTLGARAN